jgi:hypothetical protein
MKTNYKLLFAFLIAVFTVQVSQSAPFYNYICDKGVCALIPQAYFQPYPGNFLPPILNNGFGYNRPPTNYNNLNNSSLYNGVAAPNGGYTSAGYNGVGTGVSTGASYKPY